jgi:hypothetical protein
VATQPASDELINVEDMSDARVEAFYKKCGRIRKQWSGGKNEQEQGFEGSGVRRVQGFSFTLMRSFFVFLSTFESLNP